MGRNGQAGDHSQQGRYFGMATEQHQRETGEQHILARDIGQARHDQFERGKYQPPCQRDLWQRKVPHQRGQGSDAQCAAKMRAECPAQQSGGQMEQPAPQQDCGQRWRDDQRDGDSCCPDRHMGHQQPEIGQGQCGSGHRREVACHRRHDGNILDGAQAIFPGNAVLARPAVEIGVADIAGDEFIADLLARKRDKAGDRQIPEAPVNNEIGGNRREIGGNKYHPEQRITLNQGDGCVKVEDMPGKQGCAEHDQ